MTCKFKAGEKYRTKGGFLARVDLIAGEKMLGRVIHDPAIEGGWLAHSWHKDNGGSTQKSGGYEPKDFALVPPKRQVWLALLKSKFGALDVLVRDTAPDPEELVKTSMWRVVKVIGPVELEDENESAHCCGLANTGGET